MYSKERGFTLIELLVVIAIIGILSSIVMVSLGGAKAKGRDARRIADMKTIQVALDLYYNDNQMYPWNIYTTTGTVAPQTGLSPAYLSVVPTDPGASVTPATCANSPTSAGCYTYVAMGLGAAGVNCNGLSGHPLPTRYHLGAVFEDIGSGTLVQDVDAAPNANGFGACSNSNGAAGDFSGTGAGDSAARRCNSVAGTAQPGGTEMCYDMTP